MFSLNNIGCSPMSAADRDEVCELWDSESHIIVPDEFGSSKSFKDYLEFNAGLPFVVRKTSSGRIIATLIGATDGWAGYLRHAFVAQELRGNKIMRVLEELVFDNLREIYGVKEVLEFVLTDNCSGRRSLDAHGWELQEDTSIFAPFCNNATVTSPLCENEFIVRNVTAGDIAALTDFWNGHIHDSKGEIDGSEDLRRFILKNPELSALAINIESGEIVGSLLGGSDGLYANLRNFVVERAFGQSGVMELLLEYVVRQCVSRGVGYIYGIAEQNALGDPDIWDNAGWQVQNGVMIYQKSI